MKRTLLTRRWIYEQKGKEKFLFLHIPKTGGTTFRHILYNHFSDDLLYPSQKELKASGHGYLNQQQVIKNPSVLKKPLTMGHFNINLIKHMPENTKVLCFFRNPIDRFLSHTKHLIKVDPAYQGKDPNVVIRKEIHRLYCVQAQAMGHVLKAADFTKVKANIRRVNFVGMTEYFDESLKLCNAMFGWDLENIRPHNTNDNKLLLELDSKTKAILSRSLIPEIKAYNMAFIRFTKLCKKHKIPLEI